MFVWPAFNFDRIHLGRDLAEHRHIFAELPLVKDETPPAKDTIAELNALKAQSQTQRFEAGVGIGRQ